jgi:hypothetical protein
MLAAIVWQLKIKTMGLFSFLRFLKPEKSQSSNIEANEYVPVFWEDDYNQVEIVPIENKAFIERQSSEIKNQADKKDIFGFSKVYERKSLPVPTFFKEIRTDYLKYTLSGFGLPNAKHIRYNGEKIIEGQSNKVKAYGFYNFTIFFDTEDELVKYIWLSTGLIVDIAQFELIKSVLYTLGEENEFILIDWNSLEMIDLRNRSQLDNYLMGYFK